MDCFDYLPLVSVVVVSYNSSKTILSTLQSIAEQTYPKLELIIADDGSSDNTTSLVENWEEKYGSRFVRCIHAYQNVNTGVSSNINEGCKLASGKWIKPIAADDMLFPEAIEKYLNAAGQNPDVHFIVANVVRFYEENGIRTTYTDEKAENVQKRFCRSKKQFRDLLLVNPLSAPTFFFTKELFSRVGEFDLRFRNIEDWPFAIRVCKGKERVYCLDDATVLYRISISLSHGATGDFYNLNHMQATEEIKRKLCDKEAREMKSFYYFYNRGIEKMRMFFIVRVCRNKKNFVSCCIYRVFGLFMPEWWKARIKG